MRKILFFTSAILIAGLSQAATPDAVQNIKIEIKTIQRTTLEEIRQKRDALKIQIDQNAQTVKDEIKTKKEQAKTLIEQKREQMKAMLAKIKDEKKKTAVERIDTNISQLNERLTNHYLDMLNKLEKVLANISARTEKAAAAGLDTTEVQTKIAEAKTAIENSRQAVKAQAEKSYSISLTTEGNLKNDVGKVRQSFHADLKAVFQSVTTARNAVHLSATTLAKIPKVDEAGTDSAPVEP